MKKGISLVSPRIVDFAHPSRTNGGENFVGTEYAAGD